MKSKLTRILAALAVLALALPAIAQVTEDDLNRARGEIEKIQSDSQELGDRIQEGWARQLQLEHEIESLETSINFARMKLAETRKRLEHVAVEMYMASASGISMALVFNSGNDDYQAGLEYLRRVSGSDENLISELRSYQSQLDRQTQRLVEASAEQDTLLADLVAMATQLQNDLAAAQGFYDVLVEQKRREDEERRRLEEERRQREAEERRIFLSTSTTTTLAAPTTTNQVTTTTTTQPTTTTTQAATTTTQPNTTTTQSGTTTTTSPGGPVGGACPVAGPVSFTDTWGAPRSGGRTHQGVDMIAARGTPIVAIYNSVVWRLNPVDTGLGGITVWLQRPNGDRFYYAHLDSLAAISVGQQVSEGEVIGYNGSTGNAPDWLPHLHFEFHPSGSGAVNPYPLVRSIC